MQKRIRFLVYKPGLSGPREIIRALPGHRIKRCLVYDTQFRPRSTDLIINWGCSRWPANWSISCDARVLNPVAPVSVSCNKINALRILKDGGINVPEFTTDLGVARQWYDSGETVVRRGTTTGHSGAGISLHNKSDGDEVPSSAPLFTKYQPKRHEYRVHVVGNNVIDLCQKRKRRDVTQVDYRVRSWNNGWVFCRDNIFEPELIRQTGISAVKALGLDFGAVDIGWNQKHNMCTVYEVNTAPGMEGTTVLKYAEAFKEYF